MTYELIPDAQVRSKSVTSISLAALGLPADLYILAVALKGYPTPVFTLGLPFMERFYNVFDASESDNLQIGFAPNTDYKVAYNTV